MNKLIVLAAMVMAGSPAFASKARVTALGNSRQLVDVQYVFERPYLMGSVGELATMEWGAAGDAAAPHAEGGFLKKSDDAVYGVYFGRKSVDFDNTVAAATAAGIANLAEEQNPINFLYSSKMGDMTWGAGLKYSNGKNEATNNQKVSTMGLAAGVTNGTWEAELVMGLAGKSEGTTGTAESKGNTKIGFGYNLSQNTYAYVDYKMTKGDVTPAGGAALTAETTTMNLGFINTLVKNDDANFFYGVAYSSANTKFATLVDTTVTALPVWMGIEANATSWMVLRASLVQNVLINETKVLAGTKSDMDSIAFNTGAGLKLGKGMLDVNFGTAGNGQFNYATGGFLTNASYTYSF